MVTYAVVPDKFQFPLMYSFLYSLAIASISCIICTPVCVVNQATYLVMSITTIFFCTKMVNVSVFMIMLHTRFKASLSLSPNYCWTNDGGLMGFDCIYYFFIFQSPVFSLRTRSRRISLSIAVFFLAILFPTKIDSCTCFGIVIILVPYLIVCALAHFSDLKWETSYYSI